MALHASVGPQYYVGVKGQFSNIDSGWCVVYIPFTALLALQIFQFLADWKSFHKVLYIRACGTNAFGMTLVDVGELASLTVGWPSTEFFFITVLQKVRFQFS